MKNLSYINMTISEKDIEIICKIVCKDGKLTIGAPSSPSISNAILYDFDKYWFEKCQKEKILYSRYADDLYFTTNYPNKLNSVYQELIEYLSKMKSPILKLNKDKTIFTSKKHKRIITGLVLTSTEDVSVGRKKKRHIKMLVHKYCEQTIEETELKYLKGYLSFVNSVEPSFLERLRDKYGKDVITHILPLKPNNH